MVPTGDDVNYPLSFFRLVVYSEMNRVGRLQPVHPGLQPCSGIGDSFSGFSPEASILDSAAVTSTRQWQGPFIKDAEGDEKEIELVWATTGVQKVGGQGSWPVLCQESRSRRRAAVK